MNKTWTKLCEANVNHYNNHPNRHNAATIGLLIGGLTLSSAIIKRIIREDHNLRSGRYANFR